MWQKIPIWLYEIYKTYCNLVIRYRPPTFHVQAWYDEVKDYSFPYPQECNPYCPFKCSGPVCTHYTQVINLTWLFVKSFCSVVNCHCVVACLGHKQPNWLCHQPLLQHERVGTNLGKGCISCLQLFTKVSTPLRSHIRKLDINKSKYLHYVHKTWAILLIIGYVTGVIGGVMPPTNMGPHALHVLQATGEDARTISATKVSNSHSEKVKETKQWVIIPFFCLCRRW